MIKTKKLARKARDVLADVLADIPAIKEMSCPLGCGREFDISTGQGKIRMIGHCWNTHKKRVNGSGDILRGKSKRAKLAKLANHPVEFASSTEELTAPSARSARSARSVRSTTECSICMKSFKTPAGVRNHITRKHSRVRLESELVQLQAQLAKLAPTESSESPTSSAPIGEPIMINCCENCGHDIRSQNAMALIREEAMSKGKDLREFTVKFK